MRLNTINLQIVKNLGNYETLRIGAEWTPDSHQTLEEAMAIGMEELNATADMLTGKKNPNPLQQALSNGDKEKAAKEFKKVVEAEEPQPAPAAPSKERIEAIGKDIAETVAKPSEAQEKKEDEPDALDILNAGTEGDVRELITLAQPSKFNKTLGRIMAGISIEKVCEHFKFDPDTLAIIRAYLEKNRVTLAFEDPAFGLLVKAVEAQKDIANICNYIQFADQNTANAWQLALNLCNDKK